MHATTSLLASAQCAAGKEKLQRSVLHMREGAAGEQVVGLAFKGERPHGFKRARWLHFLRCAQDATMTCAASVAFMHQVVSQHRVWRV